MFFHGYLLLAGKDLIFFYKLRLEYLRLGINETSGKSNNKSNFRYKLKHSIFIATFTNVQQKCFIKYIFFFRVKCLF